MSWSLLGVQFCLELSFGVLLALAFVPKAPVGVFFYRIMGTTAVVGTLGAIALALFPAALPWSDPIVLTAIAAALCYPIYSGPLRGLRWASGLAGALVATGASVALTLRTIDPPAGAAGLTLAVATALASGAVAGSVGLAMVLGHWYLTVPSLPVRHLERLNRVTVGAMFATLLCLGLSCAVFEELLGGADRPLFEATGLFYLGTRVTVGLFFPLGFAWMTASSLRFQNTRSATGILYASTVLVLIGTAVSIALQDTYGVPL